MLQYLIPFGIGFFAGKLLSGEEQSESELPSVVAQTKRKRKENPYKASEDEPFNVYVESEDGELDKTIMSFDYYGAAKKMYDKIASSGKVQQKDLMKFSEEFKEFVDSLSNEGKKDIKKEYEVYRMLFGKGDTIFEKKEF